MLTIQVTSIGGIRPYQTSERRVWEVSYQPDSEMLLSGLYRTYSGPNHYAMWETNQNYTYSLYVSLIMSQEWWECKRWEDMWIRLIAFQLSTRCLLYRPLGRHTSLQLLLWGHTACPIMFLEAHFFLLRSHGPDVLPSVAKCFASLCRAHPTTNQSPNSLSQPPVWSLQWNNDQVRDPVFSSIRPNQWSVSWTSDQSDECDWSGNLIPLIVIGQSPADLWASRWWFQCF